MSLLNKLKHIHKSIIYRKRSKIIFYNKAIDFARLEPIFNDGCKVVADSNCGFWKNVTFRGCGFVKIGSSCIFGDNTIIYSSGKENCPGGFFIGNNVSAASNCAFYDSDHSFKNGTLINKQPSIRNKIIIEDDVCAIALRDTIIKKGAVIGAGAVVKGIIPENAIAVGVPAKVIKFRE